MIANCTQAGNSQGLSSLGVSIAGAMSRQRQVLQNPYLHETAQVSSSMVLMKMSPQPKMKMLRQAPLHLTLLPPQQPNGGQLNREATTKPPPLPQVFGHQQKTELRAISDPASDLRAEDIVKLETFEHKRIRFRSMQGEQSNRKKIMKDSDKIEISNTRMSK